MFTEAKKILNLFRRYFKINLASQMEYRVSFFVQVFGMILNNASFIFFWWVAFDITGNDIAGYGMRDVMYIWAVTSSAFGLSFILFYNVNKINNLIITGELDTYLLQPIPVLVNVLGADTMVSAWGDFFYGWAILFIFWGLNLNAILIFMLAIVLGGLLLTGILIMAQTLTFYMGKADMIGGAIFEFMINFSIYPKGIFQGVVRLLIYSLLPAAFISHIPLELVQNFSLGKLAIWVAFVGVYFTLSCVFFNRGLKKYESGNLIIARM